MRSVDLPGLLGLAFEPTRPCRESRRQDLGRAGKHVDRDRSPVSSTHSPVPQKPSPKKSARKKKTSVTTEKAGENAPKNRPSETALRAKQFSRSMPSRAQSLKSFSKRSGRGCGSFWTSVCIIWHSIGRPRHSQVVRHSGSGWPARSARGWSASFMCLTSPRSVCIRVTTTGCWQPCSALLIKETRSSWSSTTKTRCARPIIWSTSAPAPASRAGKSSHMERSTT